jgi:branched-chain amino acid transport system ATP-binding protein
MLRVEPMSAWYGAALALDGVSLQVQAGELVVLQGLNGAGKSTLLKAIMGMVGKTQGRVIWQDQDISSWPIHRRAALGLGYVAEERRLFSALSVRDNLLMTARPGVLHTTRLEDVLDAFPALRTMLYRPASHMSGGEQQMLAVARTLMTSPSLLLLDEPCEGIAPVLAEHMRDVLLSLKKRGVPMLVAEQNDLMARHADRVLRLVSGRMVGSLSHRFDPL